MSFHFAGVYTCRRGCASCRLQDACRRRGAAGRTLSSPAPAARGISHRDAVRRLTAAARRRHRLRQPDRARGTLRPQRASGAHRHRAARAGWLARGTACRQAQRVPPHRGRPRAIRGGDRAHLRRSRRERVGPLDPRGGAFPSRRTTAAPTPRARLARLRRVVERRVRASRGARSRRLCASQPRREPRPRRRRPADVARRHPGVRCGSRSAGHGRDAHREGLGLTGARAALPRLRRALRARARGAARTARPRDRLRAAHVADSRVSAAALARSASSRALAAARMAGNPSGAAVPCAVCRRVCGLRDASVERGHAALRSPAARRPGGPRALRRHRPARRLEASLRSTARAS